MPRTQDLTPPQRDAWRRRVDAIWPRDRPDIDIAREMDLDSKSSRSSDADYTKTVSGYLGEFRRGEGRALRFILDTQSRERSLCRALHRSADTFRTLLDEVLMEPRAGEDVLWLPGFEDQGTVPLDEGFVPVPLTRGGSALCCADLRDEILGAEPKTWWIGGGRGSGRSTLLRWLALGARRQGWEVRWWDGGELPRGRGLLFVVDVDPRDTGSPELRPGRLEAWRKQGGHVVLAIGSPPEAASIGAVDGAWLAGLAERARERAKGPLSRGLRTVPGSVADRVLAQGFGPGVTGSLLRDALDRGAAATDPIGALVRSACRRLTALRRDPAALAHAEEWYPEIVRGYVGSGAFDLPGATREALVQAVHQHVDAIPLTAADRDLIRSALPLFEATASLESLELADLVAHEPLGPRLRHLDVVAASRGALLLEDADALSRAIRKGEHEVLGRLAANPDAPRRLAATLEGLDAPALEVTSRDLGHRWISRVAWTPVLAGRLLAIAELRGDLADERRRLGKLSSVLRLDALPPMVEREIGGMTSTRLRALMRGVLLPDEQALGETARWAADGLGLDAPEADGMLAARAWVFADRADLVDADRWRPLLASDKRAPPPWWFEVIDSNEEVARTVLALVEASKGEIAPQVGRTVRRRALASLATSDPATVYAFAARRLDEATTAVRAGSSDDSTWRANLALGQLRGLAALPGLAAADAATRAPLTASLAPWRDWASASAEDVPLAALGADDIRLSEDAAERLGTGLSDAMVLCLDASERARWARVEPGRLGPLWRHAIWSGLDAETLIAVEDLVPVEHPDGPVDDLGRGGLLADLATTDPERLFLALVEAGDAGALVRSRGARTCSAFIRRYREMFVGARERRLLWTLHRSLDEDDVIWALVDSALYPPDSPGRFMGALDAPPSGAGGDGALEKLLRGFLSPAYSLALEGPILA